MNRDAALLSGFVQMVQTGVDRREIRRVLWFLLGLGQVFEILSSRYGQVLRKGAIEGHSLVPQGSDE